MDRYSIEVMIYIGSEPMNGGLRYRPFFFSHPRPLGGSQTQHFPLLGFRVLFYCSRNLSFSVFIMKFIFLVNWKGGREGGREGGMEGGERTGRREG